MSRKTLALRERIRAAIAVDANGCWIWQKAVSSSTGYGQIGVRRDGKAHQESAHRVAYLEFRGSIPAGLHLDHLCRVRACCNPDHLEPVTVKENVYRSPIAPGAINAAKTHCPAGHEYSPANTAIYVRRGKYPERRCRECHRIAHRRSPEQRKTGGTPT